MRLLPGASLLSYPANLKRLSKGAFRYIISPATNRSSCHLSNLSGSLQVKTGTGLRFVLRSLKVAWLYIVIKDFKQFDFCEGVLAAILF
jgi:hypothetical protein